MTVQRESRTALLGRVGASVDRIAADRMADPREVHAQLMSTPGNRLQHQQRAVRITIQSAHARRALVADLATAAHVPSIAVSRDTFARCRHPIATLAAFRER